MCYKDRSLRGDVVTPRLTIGEEGLSTYIYDQGKGYDPDDRKTFLAHCCPTYGYNEKLFLYNFRQKKVYQLADAEAARSYFKTFNPTQNAGCRGTEGYGVWVF
jgi:hypothetical protein